MFKIAWNGEQFDQKDKVEQSAISVAETESFTHINDKVTCEPSWSSDEEQESDLNVLNYIFIRIM